MAQTFAASAAQRLMWFTTQLDESPTYNVPYRVGLTGPLDIEALRGAISAVVAKHEALRTTFRYRDGELLQVVHPPTTVDLPLVDDDQPDISRHLFDLENGPLLLARLRRLDPQRHELLLVVHHLVFDGWSAELFFADLSAAYAGIAGDEPPIQYADFAQWQQEQDFQESREYWLDALKGAPTLLDLPADPDGSVGGARHPMAVPRSLAERLQQVAKSEQCTLFTVLLAAYAMALRDLSGQQDLLIGTPVAGRTHPDTVAVVGLFATMLALRADLRGVASHRDVLRRLHGTVRGGLDHQEAPFDRVLSDLAPERVIGRHPLVQVTFWLQQARAVPSLGPVEVTPVEVFNGTAKYDLTLGVRADESGMVCEFLYRTDRLDAVTVAALARRYLLALRRICDEPDQALSPLVTEEDHVNLTRWEYGPHRPLPQHRVDDLICVWMRQTPQARAVAEVTYAELAERVRTFPELPRGVRVGVALPRGVDLVVALLATLRAGAVYLPVDLDQPEQRRQQLIRDSGVGVLVTADGVARVPAPTPAGGDTAYVIHTSGSTGRPKGVEVSEPALLNRLLWGQDTHPLHHSDRVLQLTNPGFDFSIWELLAPLAFGASVVPAPPGLQQDPAALLDFVIRNDITVAHLVPTLLDAVVAGARAAAWTSLRLLFVGGEALTNELRDGALRTWDTTIVNQYGPTEATIDATAWTVVPGVPVAIGAPIANTRVRVVDEHLRPLPPGVVGELLIGGAGLANGYLERPDLTRAAFIDHEGERFYRTGDRVRWAGDGQLRFHGRTDRQTKIRGRRVELGEIETVLCAQPGVRQAAVTVHDRGTRGVVLAGYVVGGDGPLPLRAALRRVLPEALVPASLTPLAELPLTASGKVDYAALPEPDLATAPAVAAPRSPLERAVADIWRSVLDVDHVGLYDNFFDLGGHSLLMVHVQEALAAAVSTPITLLDLYECPTVDSLVAFLLANGAPANSRLDRDAERAARQREGRLRLRERR